MSAVSTIGLGGLMASRSGSVDPSKDPDEVFDLYSIPAFDDRQPEVVAGRSIGSAKQLVEPGDVLLSRIVPHIRRSWVVGNDRGRRMIASGEWIVFRNNKMHPHYLRHVLVSDSFHAQFMSTVSGVGGSLLRARPAHVGKIEVPLPSLAEQRRIAEVLDRAEALRAKRRAALAQLDLLSRAIFLDLFGDPITNPKGWPRARIDQIGDVITGNTPSRAKAEYFGDAIEWVKADNLVASNYYATRAEEGLSHAGKALARVAPAQSILVTCIAGSPASIGNAAMTDREVAYNQQINAFVPRHGDPDFFYAQIVVAKRLVQQVSTAAMKGMVSKSRFQQIRLISPPLTLQRQFARSAAAVERLKGAHRASLAEMDALFASLQHRAFQGEL